jgi:hypothetical protein
MRASIEEGETADVACTAGRKLQATDVCAAVVGESARSTVEIRSMRASLLNLVNEVVLGAVVLCLTLLLHGLGMTLVRKCHAVLVRLRPSVPISHRPAFSVLILLMLATHILEILLWAATLVLAGATANIQDASYYVAVTYTTLGYGENTLTANWRMVAPMIAISGLFAFGWTTSTLFNIVQEILPQAPADRERR